MNVKVKENIQNGITEADNSKLPALVRNGDMDLRTWQTIKDVIFPGVENDHVIEVAVNYCKARNLDIMKKPVHIVKFGGKEVILPGISEIRTTAFRTGLYAGKDSAIFGPTTSETWKWTETWNNKTYNKEATVQYPEWVEQTVYRLVGGNQKAAFIERVWWKEAYATINAKEEAPNQMWRERPFGQLAKCGEAASLRCAFPEELGGLLAAEEVSGASNYAEKQPPEPKEEKGDPVEMRLRKKAESVTEAEIIPPSQQEENFNLTKAVEELAENPKPPIFLPEEFSIETYRIIKKGKVGTVQYGNISDLFSALKSAIGSYKNKPDRQAVYEENKLFISELDRLMYIDDITILKDLINEGA